VVRTILPSKRPGQHQGSKAPEELDNKLDREFFAARARAGIRFKTDDSRLALEGGATAGIAIRHVTLGL
jgi:hypothetical protein